MGPVRQGTRVRNACSLFLQHVITRRSVGSLCGRVHIGVAVSPGFGGLPARNQPRDNRTWSTPAERARKLRWLAVPL